MAKVKISQGAVCYPMPMTLVGATVDGKPNFLAVAWAARVNYKPPMVAVALGKSHYTNGGIHANKTFSVNVPSVDLVKETDHCGLVSGKKEDKSRVFDVFYGELKTAPMVSRCPLCMECKLVDTLDMEIDTLFIGEIVSIHCDEACLTDGNPDIAKINPFIFSSPDHHYWTLGQKIGKAWDIGKTK